MIQYTVPLFFCAVAQPDNSSGKRIRPVVSRNDYKKCIREILLTKSSAKGFREYIRITVTDLMNCHSSAHMRCHRSA